MKMTYLVGRRGTGKTTYMFQEIQAALAQGKEQKLIYLVPEQFTLQAERDLLQRLALEGMLQVEVLSFTRLAYQVFNEVGGLARVVINDLGKNMVLRRVMEELSKELTIYQKISKGDGFLTKVNELIAEMKQYDILPQELGALAQGEEEPILQRKLKDIALLYEHFNRYLSRGYWDVEDQMNHFIEGIGHSKALEGALIWIDGFHRFTPQTLRMIGALLKKVEGMTLALAYDPKHRRREGDLFTTTERTLQQLKELAASIGVPQRMIVLEQEGMERPQSLKHLEREIYAYPYESYQGNTDAITLFSATNGYTEIEAVAQEILRLVRDQGMKYQDIAIVAGDLDAYGRMIKRVFQEYGIPYFMDEKRGIMDHPLVELILAAVEVVSKGFQYEGVFRYLKTGFSDLTIDQVEELENYVIAYGIRGKEWEKPFVKSNGEDLTYYNQLRECFYQPLGKLQRELKGAANLLEMTQGIFAFLQEMKVQEKLEEWIEILKQQGRYDSVNENTQIWNTIMEIFDQLAEILGEQQLPLGEFGRILEAGFSACEIGVIPATIDQVLVGNLDRSRSHEIQALFVVGVNDGLIPSLREEKGLLSDQERSLLRARGINLGPEGDGRQAEERLAIYLALSKPTQFLWLSYALADQEGRALRPSILIDRMKKLFPGIPVKSDLSQAPGGALGQVGTPHSTFKYLVENMRHLADGGEMDPLWWEVLQWYRGEAQWEERTDWMCQGLFHENQLSYLGDGQAKGLYQNPVYASVSRLERFANCPFSHLVAYGLRPKERKEYQLKYPDIGRLFHYSLELFGKALQTNNLNWAQLEQEQCDGLVEEIIDHMMENFENGILQSTHRYRYMVKRLKQVSKRAVWTLTSHLKQGGFQPLGYEISFGPSPDATLPPMILELEEGTTVVLQGVIDRVDILQEEEGEYIKIIDYKSGNQDFSLSDVYYGLQLQLLVYLDAVLSSRNFGKVQCYPGGIFYFKIDDPLVKTTAQATEVIEREINKALKLRGMVLKDLKVIKAMDHGLEGTSEIIPVRLNKGDEIAKSSSVLTGEDFQRVLSYIRQLIQEISREIMKGNVRIFPCKKGKTTSCQTCQYQGICQFDPLLQDNEYRIIKEMKDDEVIEKIKGVREEKTNDPAVDAQSRGSH